MVTSRNGALIAAAVMVVGVWLPWAHVTIEILGAQLPALTVDGDHIGSDVGSIPWGWFVGGAGLVGLIAVLGGKPSLAVGAGLAGVVFAVMNLSTLDASKMSATIDGEDVSRSIDPHVSPAWGSWVVLVASGLLLVCAWAAMRARAETNELEPTASGVSAPR